MMTITTADDIADAEGVDCVWDLEICCATRPTEFQFPRIRGI